MNGGYGFAKAGVLCNALVPADAAPPDLFTQRDSPREQALMQALGSINQCFGRDRAVVGAVGLKRAWMTKFDMRSLRYTTRLDELPRRRTGATPFIGMAQTPPTL